MNCHKKNVLFFSRDKKNVCFKVGAKKKLCANFSEKKNITESNNLAPPPPQKSNGASLITLIFKYLSTLRHFESNFLK